MPYISTLPCLLMLIYTLVMLPYLSLIENLRSAFSYLAMCSFLAFNIYVLRIASEEVSSKEVYLFLVVNLGVVLLIISLVVLILCLYYCHKKLFQVDLKK